MGWSNGQRQDSFLGLGTVIQEVLCVEASSVHEVRQFPTHECEGRRNLPNNNRGSASRGLSITLSLHNQLFNINELPQPRLLLPIRHIRTRRAHQTHIRHFRLLPRSDQLHGDIELVLVRGRDDAQRVGAGFLQRGDHVLDLAGLVRDDGGAELLELLALGGCGVQREAADGVDLAGERRVAEE